MSEHAWTLEHLATYTAGGLDAAETERLEQHVAECPGCAAALAEARALDASLESLFVGERPDPALEDRMIRSLRGDKRRRKSRLPMAIRIAIASAAVLLVGIVGAAASQIILEGELPLPGATRSPREVMVSILDGHWQSVVDSRTALSAANAEAMARASATNNLRQLGLATHRDPELEELVNQSTRWAIRGAEKEYNLRNEEAGLDPSKMLSYNVDRIENTRVAGPDDLTQPLGIKGGDPAAANDLGYYPPARSLIVKGTSRFDTSVGGPGARGRDQTIATRGLVDFDGQIPIAFNGIGQLRTGEDGRRSSSERLEEWGRLRGVNRQAGDVSSATPPPRDNGRVSSPMSGSGDAKEVGPGGGGGAPAASPGGTGAVNSTKARSESGQEGKAQPQGQLKSTLKIDELQKSGQDLSRMIPPPEQPAAKLPSIQDGRSHYTFSYKDNRPNASMLDLSGGQGKGGGASEKKSEGGKDGLAIPAPQPAAPPAPGTSTGGGSTGGEFFRPGDAAQKETVINHMLKPGQDPEPVTPVPVAEPQGEGRKGDDKNKPQNDTERGPNQGAGRNDNAKPPPGPRKIIIRSGDIEFEIDSFDSAVATVTKLVNAINGGFIATINSEKLPNGKVKGSVVVRVPPEALDGLVLDLRKELGKIGELKGQKIGSQDITKQYTDLESRLRAAKAMEERLLNIIKSGKGEIKDLLLAEKELGVWRTKIEEYEGELRYYSQLVALSTLNISIYEKEIRSPAALTETERVSMGLEVEDVDKTLREAIAAVNEAKGRVTKSEMKQHGAGQFQATLQFEVSPEASGTLRDRLRQLGNVTRLEIDRVTKTEGGTGRPGEMKSRKADSQYTVSLYNVMNVAPRETLQVQLAAADAEALYKAILARVEKAGGRVVTSNLNRQRADQTSGTVHFEVKTAEGEAVLADLKVEGEVLHLQLTENPDTQNVTRSKRGYQVQIFSLHNASVVVPHTTVQLNIAAADAEEAFKTVLARVEKAGGRVITSNLNRQRNDQTQGTIHFEVKTGEADAILPDLRILGEVMRLQTVENTSGQYIARTKRGFQVQVWALGAVQPRETTSVQLAVEDVRAVYQTLQDAVAKAKGRILNAQLNEQDARNLTGTLDFEVRRPEETAIAALLTKSGITLTRSVARAQDSETVIDSKVRFQVGLSDTVNLQPRETVTVQVAARDVAGSYRALHEAILKAKARVLTAQINEQDRDKTTGNLGFDATRADEAAFEALFAKAGTVLSRGVTRAQSAANVLDTKVRYQVELISVQRIPPREGIRLVVEGSNVEQLAATLPAMVAQSNGRTVDSTIALERDGRTVAKFVFDVPLAAAADLVEKVRSAGTVRVFDRSHNPQGPEHALSFARVEVGLWSVPPIVAKDDGVWTQVRKGLTTSVQWIGVSLMWAVVGLAVVVPWALIIWGITKLVMRLARRQEPAPATTP